MPNLSTRLSDIIDWSKEQSGAILGKDIQPVSTAIESIKVHLTRPDNDWSLEHFLGETNELSW